MQIELHGITKRFGGVLANDGVDLELRAGEVMALLGENGAGKSTLMKILYGFHQADAGHVRIDGRQVAVSSPRAAMAHGIGMVFQRFNVIPALTVRENLALADPRTPWRIGRGARRCPDVLRKLAQVAPEIDPEVRAGDLSIGQIQLVELAKVLSLDARLVILDEPSAVLTPEEAHRLWGLIRALREQGLSVVLITHKLADVAACADRVTVMRQGRVVASLPYAQTTPEALVHLMVGARALSAPQRVALRDATSTRVWIKRISAGGPAGSIVDVDLRLARGEVLGVAGVSGNGQNILADACAGVLPVSAGEVILDGDTLFAPRQAPTDRGRVAYIPEQPLRNACAPDLSAAVNLFLKRVGALSFIPDRRQMDRAARELMAGFDVRPPNPTLRVDALSGGNLQKLVAARELSQQPPLVVACYPTMGLDLGAAAALYQRLFALAEAGSAVLWISEDLDDLLRYAHRIAVLFRGRVAGVVDAAHATHAQLGAWMTGMSAPAEVPA